MKITNLLRRVIYFQKDKLFHLTIVHFAMINTALPHVRKANKWKAAEQKLLQTTAAFQLASLLFC